MNNKIKLKVSFDAGLSWHESGSVRVIVENTDGIESEPHFNEIHYNFTNKGLMVDLVAGIESC